MSGRAPRSRARTVLPRIQDGAHDAAVSAQLRESRACRLPPAQGDA